MDLDAKISNFRKKALWKQIEGYKQLLALKESELKLCSEERDQARRAEIGVNSILLKTSSDLTANAEERTTPIHENLLPLFDALKFLNLKKETLDNFNLVLLTISLLMKNAKVTFRSFESGDVVVKDAKMSELKSKIEEDGIKILSLENKIFSMEKKIASLQISASGAASQAGSPSKRPRNEDGGEDQNALETCTAEQESQDKIKVLKVESEELKKIANERLAELDVIFLENQKLKTDLEKTRCQLARVPAEFWDDHSSFRYLVDDLRRLKGDLSDASSTIKKLEREASDSNYRHSKVVSQLEHDIREKYNRLEDFIKSTDVEIGRLRKDRDSMRQMYEHTNSLLSSAQKQIQAHQSNSTCAETAIKSLTETVSKLKSHISTLPNAGGKGAELESLIDTLRADEQVYVEELEALGKAFENIQLEVSDLIKKLADKDDQMAKMMAEKLKAEFALSQVQRETESGLLRAQKVEELAKHRVSETEAREHNLLRQVSSMEKDLSDRIVAADGYKSRLSEASAEIGSLRSRIDRLNSELNDLKGQAPHSGQKDQAAYEKRRLVEDLTVAKKKLEAYASSGVGIVKELEDELLIYKKLMKCNSCHTRDKNAVILKCMHCFCKNCLDIRLETRQRKCPNCGDSFGASDVKQIYL